MNRFQYVEYLLGTLDSKANERAHFVTILLWDDDYHDLKNGEKINPSISLKNQTFLQDWIGPEMGLWSFHLYSKEMREKYEEGDSEAIYDFCNKTNFAFRANWVLELIEKWRVLNTKESLQNIKRIFKSYTNSRGKSSRELLTEILLRDHEIYKRALEYESQEESKKNILNRVANDYFISYESAREIYFAFQKFYKTIIMYRSNFRGVTIGFPKNIPEYDEIDPLLEDLFGFRSFVDSLGTQVMEYKFIRQKYCNLKYHNGITIERTQNPTMLFSTIENVIKEHCTQQGKDSFWVRDAYDDFLKWEILRNHDKNDIAKGLPFK